MYLRNWSRTLTIRRALPLPVDVAAVQDKWALCGAMYIGYLELLRTGELLSLRVSQVTDYADTGCVVLSLPDSKRPSARMSGSSSCLRTFTPECCCEHWWPERRRPTPCSGCHTQTSNKAWRRPRRPLGCLGTLLRLTLCGGVGPPTISRALRRWTSLRSTAAGRLRRYISPAMSDLESVKQPQEGPRPRRAVLHESSRCCSECRCSSEKIIITAMSHQ